MTFNDWRIRLPWFEALWVCHERARSKEAKDFYFDWMWDISFPGTIKD